ncbi:MAG: phospholipase D family protein [Candidatus Diapherotrites archaeon]
MKSKFKLRPQLFGPSLFMKILIVAVLVVAILGMSYYFPNTLADVSLVSKNLGEFTGLTPKPVAVQIQTETVYLCPEDACANELEALIDSADSQIHAAVYSFTLDSLGDALVRAHERGVKVSIVLEKDQISQYSEFDKLVNAGIDARIDSNPASMHNKFAIIDSEIVATGSFNWSQNADTKNDENLLILRSKELSAQYELEFQEIFGETA